MGVGEIVGGIALVGVAVLIGFAITDSDEPETLTEAASTLVDPAAAGAGATSTATTLAPDTSSESTSSESTAPAEPTDPTDPDTTEAEPDETPPTETAATVVPASSTTTSTIAAPTTPAPATTPAPPTTLSPEQRAAVNVKVLNGGAASGAAGDMTAAIRFTGFSAAGPADARVRVPANTVLYAPFQRPAAEAVNQLVGAQPANLLEASPADPNWAAFGAGLDVLVVLGLGRG